MSLGVPELLIILVIILVLFGASRLPGIAKSLGSSAKEFRKGLEDDDDDDEDDASDSSDG